MPQRDPAEKIQGSGEIPIYLSALGRKEEGDEDMGGNDLRAERKKMNKCGQAIQWDENMGGIV